MYVYWVTSGKPTANEPCLFLSKELAEEDAKIQNQMRGEEVFRVREVEVF